MCDIYQTPTLAETRAGERPLSGTDETADAGVSSASNTATERAN